MAKMQSPKDAAKALKEWGAKEDRARMSEDTFDWFRAEDFNVYGLRGCCGHGITINEAAKIANETLQRILKERGVRVVCRNDSGKWACDEHTGFAYASHSGTLIDIKPLKEG